MKGRQSDYSIPESLTEESKKFEQFDVQDKMRYICFNYRKPFTLIDWFYIIGLFIINSFLIALAIFFIVIQGLEWESFLFSMTSIFSFGLGLLYGFDAVFPTKLTGKNYLLVAIFAFIVVALFSNIFWIFNIGINPISSIISTYIAITLPLLVVFTFQKRVFGVGVMRFFGLEIYNAINNLNFWGKDKKKAIINLLRSWDDWLADLYQLRVKDLDPLEGNLFNEIIYNPSNLQSELITLLNQDFFDQLKAWNSPENISKISNSLKIFFEDDLKITFSADNILLRLARRLNRIDIISLLIGVVSGVILTIMAILGVFI